MFRHVVIMQGISGSGKSTKAREIIAAHPDKRSVVVSSDDYFYTNGSYNFDPLGLSEAHKTCMQAYHKALHDPEMNLIIVDNTNTTLVEISFYYHLANIENWEISLVQVSCTTEEALSRNVHNVPSNIITRQFHNLRTFEVPKYWNIFWQT